MNLTNQIYPTQDQLTTLLEQHDMDKPVTMLNIIKYKEGIVDGRDAKEVYHNYLNGFKAYIKDLNVELVWMGDISHTIIGPAETPDLVFIVRWERLEDFINMLSDSTYQSHALHRNISIQYGGLWACTEHTPVPAA